MIYAQKAFFCKSSDVYNFMQNRWRKLWKTWQMMAKGGISDRQQKKRKMSDTQTKLKMNQVLGEMHAQSVLCHWFMNEKWEFSFYLHVVKLANIGTNTHKKSASTLSEWQLLWYLIVI